MTVVYDRWGVQVHHGDCLDIMRGMPADSVHSVVTDPPAGISFMGKSWDSNRGGRAQWVEWLTERMTEAHRVLKPGGHALVWALPRTSHWTAWALEDAGFEVRDCITHIFGNGMPKSREVAKDIEKRGMSSGDPVKFKVALGEAVRASGKTRTQINNECGFTMRFDIPFDRDPKGWGCSLPTAEQYSKIRCVLGEIRGWPQSKFDQVYTVVGHEDRFNSPSGLVGLGRAGTTVRRELTEPTTAAGWQWAGWGTGLKPAAEHWWLVRKPLSGTVASTVLEHGTGALNIDSCRVAVGRDYRDKFASVVGLGSNRNGDAYGSWTGARVDSTHDGGRWPSNVVLSHGALLDSVTGEVIGDACADECVEGCSVADLDSQSGMQRDGLAVQRNGGGQRIFKQGEGLTRDDQGYGGGGGASRFFPVFRWEAKAPTVERPRVNGKSHETVKSVALMRWLVRLVTPLGGVVLDCFAGTGTTGQAARAEGFSAVLVEEDALSVPLITARLDALPKTETPVNGEVVVADRAVDLFSFLDGAST